MTASLDRPRRRRGRLLLAAMVAALASLASAYPAHATDIVLKRHVLKVNHVHGDVRVDTLASPRNTLRLTVDAPGTLPGRCTKQDDGTVLCGKRGIKGITIRGGGEANVFTSNTNIPSLLLGGGGKDTLTGGSAADSIDGGPGKDDERGRRGNDLIFGRSGNDVIRGGSGVDHVDGQGGNDRIFGGSGADILVGGSGNDALFGQGGRDVLDGRTGRDTCVGGAARDILTSCERE
jgi:Ca2+-binding RTX toxin-like protein